MANNIKFVLNGCDILFFAEAPEDITLKQLLEQTDKISPIGAPAASVRWSDTTTGTKEIRGKKLKS